MMNKTGIRLSVLICVVGVIFITWGAPRQALGTEIQYTGYALPWQYCTWQRMTNEVTPKNWTLFRRFLVRFRGAMAVQHAIAPRTRLGSDNPARNGCACGHRHHPESAPTDGKHHDNQDIQTGQPPLL